MEQGQQLLQQRQECPQAVKSLGEKKNCCPPGLVPACSPFEVFEGHLSCLVLGCLLAGALTSAAGVANGDPKGEIRLMGLALGFEKVVHGRLSYSGPILLKKADRGLARVGGQHLLYAGQPAACSSAGP